jgi:hypothetical protein
MSGNAIALAKQVLVQRVREVERGKIFDEYKNRVGEIITGTVQQQDRTGVLVTLGKAEAFLPKKESIRRERWHQGLPIKAYVLEVLDVAKGPQVILSRTHAGLIEKLFESEVPEIYDGIVEIKSVARDAGGRTKIAVHSKDDRVDAVGEEQHAGGREPLHRAVHAHQEFEAGPVVGDVGGGRGVDERVEDAAEAVGVERLGEESDDGDPLQARVGDDVAAAVAADEHHRDRTREERDATGELHAVHHGHHHVGDHDGELLHFETGQHLRRWMAERIAAAYADERNLRPPRVEQCRRR